LHKASSKIVESCVDNDISTVIIGNVANSLNGINLGKRNNQNFVNISLGQFVKQLQYKLEAHNVNVQIIDESYTSKASFIDNDEIPENYNPDEKYIFSGRRVKRGLYKSRDGIKINADVNGAFNILRKVVPEFSFEQLLKKVNDGIAGWFLPHTKIVDLSTKVSVK
jgi:putative transposase